MTRPAVAYATLPLPARDAWELLVDVRNHERWIPMTRIEAPARLDVGGQFEGVSGPSWLPALGLADRMVVERCVPPVGDGRGVVVYRKLGPLLLGTAEVHVRPAGPAAADVAWVERIHLRGLPPAATAWLLRPVLAAMVRFALGRVQRELRDGGVA